MPEEPFAVPRDYWGRPMVVPPEGGPPVAYTRVTTVAGTLEDKEGLVRWKGRMIALGLSLRPDLLEAIATLPGTKEFDALCEAAADHAGANIARDRGDALHRATEQVDLGKPVTIPGIDQKDLDAYRRALEDYARVDIEAFGVIDDRMIGGTWDRVLVAPGGRLVMADLKTGDISRPQKIEMQLAMYARATPYAAAGMRGESNPDRGVDQDHGLVIHLEPGKGSCELYWADLNRGWQDTLLAIEVRHSRRRRPALEKVAAGFPQISDPVLEALLAAGNVDDLRALWALHNPSGDWTELHTAAALVRKRFLLSECE